MSDASKRTADAAGLGADPAKRTRAEDAPAGADAFAVTVRNQVAAALQQGAATERAPADATGGVSASNAASAFDKASLREAFSDAAMLRLSWSDFEEAPVRNSHVLKGSFGEVLRMRDLRRVGASDAGTHAPDAFVAVKTLLHGADTEFELEEEAALLKELLTYHRLGRKPDVDGWCPLVAFLGVLAPCPKAERSYGLLLEWYGISLERVLRQPPATFDAAARRTVARHVALACRFLHDEAGPTNGRGIVHRDIKPSNVLVDERYNPQTGACYNAKLADFGTSRFISSLGEGCATMRKPTGTSGYMAPELLYPEGAAEQPKKVDVWSFGVLLYDLFSEQPLKRPWWYSNDPRYRAIIEAEPPRPKHEEDWLTAAKYFFNLEPAPMPELPASCSASTELRKLQAACCAREPAKRPSFREIWAQLQRTSARLVLRYKPMVPHGAEALEVHASLDVVDAQAQVDADAALSDTQTDSQDEITVEFVVPVREGDTCSVELSPVGGAAYDWLGKATGLLGPPLPPLKATPAGEPPLRTATLLVKPDWAACPAGGVRCALRLRWKRAAVSDEAAAADDAAARADKAPPMSLGALSLRMGMPLIRSLLPCSSLMRSSGNSDVFVSYRDTETGRVSGTQFVLKLLVPGLRRAGFTVFCYAEQLHKGDSWVNVLTDGILASRAFIPVCSPTYADLYESPWGSNELAAAARAAATSGIGAPYIQPLWHSGAFPPPDTAAVLIPLAARRVPAGPACGDEKVAGGEGDALIAELVEALKAAGISPSNAVAPQLVFGRSGA